MGAVHIVLTLINAVCYVLTGAETRFQRPLSGPQRIQQQRQRILTRTARSRQECDRSTDGK